MPFVLQPHLSRFFENLPYLPFIEVSKHLGSCDLIKLSLLSDNWKQAILKRDWKEFTVIDWKSDNDKSELSISFDDNNRYDTKEKFKIEYVHGEMENVQMRDDGSMMIHTRMHRNLINRRILETCNFWKINFEFYLGKWNSHSSTWMTRFDLMKIDFRWVNFNSNCFNSRDFNILLHHWVNGTNQKAIVWKFQVSENNVNIEDVLRGLETKKWNPKSRDRKYSNQTVDGIWLPAIDLEHGFDIYSTTEKHGTVQIIEDVLYFCVWINPFAIMFLDEILLDSIKQHNRILNRLADNEKKKEKELESRWKLLQSLRNIRGNQELEVEDLF